MNCCGWETASSRRERGGRGESKAMTENEIGTVVVESSIRVHRELGASLLESVYEAALAMN